MSMIPTSGAYAKILYEFEDVFGFPPGNVVSQEAAMGITRILGHGIRVDSWSKDNGLKAVIGLNNVEPSAIVDGPFNGNFSLSFAMTGDISWMKAVMGGEIDVNTRTKRYTKNIAPPSMSFVVYINNDSEDADAGDMFLITGVIVSNVSLSTAEDAPVTVQMDCVYKTEYKYDDVTNIPVINPPADDVFNTAMVNAYFWNPNTDINGPSSFDSIECTIDKVNFSIKHTANLIRGIGTRVAKNKVHTNIEYEMSMDAVFQDPKKFLERFYGCPSTPSKYIAPYEQIMIVVENFFRDSRHAKVEFKFRNAKIRTSGLPLAIENVIMENLGILPISCNIEVTRGCPAEASVYVSPSVVYAGNELYISGANFFPGESITIEFDPVIDNDGVDIGTIDTYANCLGELMYPIVLGSELVSGTHQISVLSGTSIQTAKVFEILVQNPSDKMAQINMCKKVLAKTIESVIITGFNFTDAGTGNATITLEKYDYTHGTWDPSGAVTNGTVSDISDDGSFTQTVSVTVGAVGKYRFKATRGTTGVNQKIAVVEFYVPGVSKAALSTNVSAKDTLTIYLTDLPPMADVTMLYDTGATATNINLGVYGADANGYMPGYNSDWVYTRLSAPFPDSAGDVLTVTVMGVNGGNFVFEGDITS